MPFDMPTCIGGIVLLHLKPRSGGWTLLVSERQIVQFLIVVKAGIALGFDVHADKLQAERSLAEAQL